LKINCNLRFIDRSKGDALTQDKISLAYLDTVLGIFDINEYNSGVHVYK
jgi:hypothetical protein